MSLLSAHESIQPAIVKIKELLDERLNKYRMQNDHPSADSLLRGRIAEIKTLQKILFTPGVR